MEVKKRKKIPFPTCSPSVFQPSRTKDSDRLTHIKGPALNSLRCIKQQQQQQIFRVETRAHSECLETLETLQAQSAMWRLLSLFESFCTTQFTRTSVLTELYSQIDGFRFFHFTGTSSPVSQCIKNQPIHFGLFQVEAYLKMYCCEIKQKYSSVYVLPDQE